MSDSMYSKYVERPDWQHVPALSRIILGTRKEKRLSLRDLAKQIATSPDEVTKVATQIEIFESGGVINERLLEFLIPLLDLDPDEMWNVIEAYRLEELRRFEDWDFAAPGIEITFCFSKNAGVTRPAPPEVSTPRQAEIYASAVAKERAIQVILDVRRRVQMRFDVTGKLVTVERASPAGWSRYPFSKGMHDVAPSDEHDNSILSVTALRNGIRSMAEALCRARGLDPHAYRHGLPGWYSVVDSQVAALFKDEKFWTAVAAQEGTPLDLNDVVD